MGSEEKLKVPRRDQDGIEEKFQMSKVLVLAAAPACLGLGRVGAGVEMRRELHGVGSGGGAAIGRAGAGGGGAHGGRARSLPLPAWRAKMPLTTARIGWRASRRVGRGSGGAASGAPWRRAPGAAIARDGTQGGPVRRTRTASSLP